MGTNQNYYNFYLSLVNEKSHQNVSSESETSTSDVSANFINIDGEKLEFCPLEEVYEEMEKFWMNHFVVDVKNGSKSYRCTSCPEESFENGHKAFDHITSKHLDLVVCCNICGRGFEVRSALYRHRFYQHH